MTESDGAFEEYKGGGERWAVRRAKQGVKIGLASQIKENLKTSYIYIKNKSMTREKVELLKDKGGNLCLESDVVTYSQTSESTEKLLTCPRWIQGYTFWKPWVHSLIDNAGDIHDIQCLEKVFLIQAISKLTSCYHRQLKRVHKVYGSILQQDIPLQMGKNVINVCSSIKAYEVTCNPVKEPKTYNNL